MKLIKEIDVFERYLLQRAREDILAFAMYVKKDFNVGSHHRIFAEALNRFVSGECKRLMIFCPPRHGKSEMVSRMLPAYVFGRNPDAKVIGASYGADLAAQMNRDVQRIMTSEAYARIFGDSKLNEKNIKTSAHGNYLRNSEAFEVVGHRGFYKSVGVGGALTGFGADVAIIDDPIKNSKEADSKTFRDNVWDWYQSVLYTRLERGNSVLLTLTRWHEDDLAGRLLESQGKEDADQWEIIKIPAIKEEDGHPLDMREVGEALWPWKYPIEKLRTIKSMVGSRFWNAMYQQRPSASEGGIIKREWVKFYHVLPSYFNEQFLSMDAAFAGKEDSDYVVIQCWGRAGSQFYLIDQIRDRMDFPTTVQMFKMFCEKHKKANAKLIEVKANGQAICDSLSRDIPGMIEIRPTESKESRVQAISAFFEAGNVLLPQDKNFALDFIEEAVTFPTAAHDDQIDCAAQAINWAKYHISQGGAALYVAGRR